MASSMNTTLMMVSLWHSGHRYIELSGEEFYCNLCKHNSTTRSGLIIHLRGTTHKNNLDLAKTTVFKKQRFPFNDSVLLFDRITVNLGKPYHPLLDKLEGECAKHLKELPPFELIQRIGNFSSTFLKTIPPLNIEEFNYASYPVPVSDQCSSHLQIFSHTDIKKMGELQLFMRYDVMDVDKNFLSEYQIEKELCEIDSIWCEWYNVVDDNHDDDDDDDYRVDGHHSDAIIVMKFFHGMGSSKNETEMEPKICFLCDRRINVGSDVGALLDTASEYRIICCRRNLFNARNKERNINILKEFHCFHFSCVVKWLLCNFCSTACDNPDPEYLNRINGKQIYSEQQMAIVKEKIAEGNIAWSSGLEKPENSSIGLKFKNLSSEKVVHLWQTSVMKDKTVASSTSSEEYEKATVKQMSKFVVYCAEYKAPLAEVSSKEDDSEDEEDDDDEEGYGEDFDQQD